VPIPLAAALFRHGRGLRGLDRFGQEQEVTAIVLVMVPLMVHRGLDGCLRAHGTRDQGEILQNAPTLPNL
jgi:hypothetical protein